MSVFGTWLAPSFPDDRSVSGSFSDERRKESCGYYYSLGNLEIWHSPFPPLPCWLTCGISPLVCLQLGSPCSPGVPVRTCCTHLGDEDEQMLKKLTVPFFSHPLSKTYHITLVPHTCLIIQL